MLTRITAVALVVAAALALEAAFLHALVAAPLSSAIAALEGAPGAPTFEERITVVAERPRPEARGDLPGPGADGREGGLIARAPRTGR